MNTENNGTRIQLIHRFFLRFFLATLLVASAVPVALAGEVEEHNPYTIYGMRLRSHLIPETSGATDDLGPLVFQEIVPCRFVSTVDEDKFDNPWGGKEYQMMETRTYFPKGELVSSKGWVNPCSRQVPVDALAVSLRLTSIAPANGTNLFLAPATQFARPQNGIWFAGGRNEMKEANVVLVNGGFSMGTDQITHLTVDIIGFFLPDPMGAGAQGEKGDKGDRGEAGAQGEKGDRGEAGAQGEKGGRGEAGAQGEKGDRGEAGAQGEKGDRGEAGAQGEKGDRGEAGAQGEKGDRGEAGAQGEKGDRGEAGAQGEKGERGEAGAQGQKGDRGDAGAQGEKGERGEAGAQGQKGDRGDAGAQGEKGERGEAGAQGQKGDRGDAGVQGEKGERGEAGAQGQKGDRGDAGAQGQKGDRGEAGAQGLKGEKGDAGATGGQGPAGAQGPQGPAGPQGPKGEAGKAGLVASIGGPYVFPPGGSITIHDGLVTPNSFILLTYVEVSNGNALGVASVGTGSFVASGSPNKPFKYVVIAIE